ncbi:RNA polymerase, sigma-24 subunit, ECF subfamily [Delftia sp. Cs1-4]|uniref:RNA polymerase sigma factor n=1 Tax=unclassified Delftia TaxID=2613839 RepID=UPI00020E851D|nr:MULTISPECIES: sigma-70 family RNA polymerase sigma factor [unclassified Delftia]AEF90732.1 RNA polymerase, sigma-24 subunit, ECF subfamily [Delftia sp. Cs1-4]KZK28189.1 RNA polymerase subunit sigma-24 [Delftia sp. GW456-R20]
MDRSQILEHLPGLRRYARLLAGDAWAADDLVQDTLERACRKWLLWRPDGDLRAWLFTLMHNLYLNQRRSAARGQWLDIDSLSETLAAPEDSSDAALDLERCLQRLPAEQRAVLLLVSVEDMSYADTARVLHLPLGTVMSRLSRARSRLRELMEAPSATSASSAAPAQSAPTAKAATPQAAAPALRRLK